MFLTDSGDIHLPRPDKLQSPGDRVEPIATIDVPLQNGGTKTQEENPDPSECLRAPHRQTKYNLP